MFLPLILSTMRMSKLLVKRSLRSSGASSLGLLLGMANNALLKETLTVFVYHDISEHPSEFSHRYDLNVYPDVFDYQLAFIKNNFNIISPDNIDEAALPPKAALITFDDGFRSFFLNAIPILEKHGVPAIIFLNMEAVLGKVFWAGLLTYLCTKRKDFAAFMGKNTDVNPNVPLFLSCDRETVEAYLKQLEYPIDNEVIQYVGAFASKEDLERASKKEKIFFGNHLFNHYVPRLMSDEDFLRSFSENEAVLRQYSNYLKMFSFPFGQPNSCFLPGQIDLLKSHGVNKVFSSSGRVNGGRHQFCMDRLALTLFHNSPSKIWFQIFQQSLRKGLNILK